MNKGFGDITKEMTELYERKNSDYGNSFHDTYVKFGMIAPTVRLMDKIERLGSIIRKQSHNYESERDTLIDIANYAVMTLMEMDSAKES